MVCPVCNGQTKAGKPCKHRTCKYAPKCMHHTQVQVKPSNISGRGLFAKGAIRKGQVVGDYTKGTAVLSHSEFTSKYPTGRATHVFRHQNGLYFDATDGTKSVAGFANRAPRGKRNNARITGGGKLTTLRAIKDGEEILVGYGPGFRI